MTARRLLVLLYGELVATIDQARPTADPELTYDSDYAAQGAVPVGLRLPVAMLTHRGRSLDAFLDGILPESRGTRTRWAERLDVDADDTIGILANMGWDCPGAVQFCTPEQFGDLEQRSDDYAEVSDAEIAARLRALRETDSPS
ncbi:MAG: HipA N-terminal domain-containing protein, partial [Acidimicrobiia bacterium]